MERLTQDLTIDILSWLPIRSLLCCKCVCKTWHTIISDPVFSTLQLHRSSSSDLFFHFNFSIEYGDFYISESGSRYEAHSQESDFYLALGNEDRFEEDDDEDDSLILRPSKTVHVPFFIDSWKDFNVLGSCNGLLVLSTIWNTESVTMFATEPIYIFNPITGEHLQLPSIRISPELGIVVKFLSGFGFDVSTQDFKLVILLFYVPHGSDVLELESTMNEMHVYPFRSNTWSKETGNVPNVLLDTCQVFSYVFINGSLYWSAIDVDSRLHILSLHLGSEDFGEIPTPDLPLLAENTSKQFAWDQSDQFALGVLEECLSLVDYSHENFIDIWQMMNNNGNEHWVKLLSIDREVMLYSLQSRSVMCLEYGKKGEILLMGSSNFVVYNAESSTCTKVWVAVEGDGNCRAIPFVGSLISIRLA
ncbi:hypothetical protein FRX31_016966 [Thalictrum thalictroides]|uniref:F-box domain-containing protein n=1 Tax=Thalictrum thalictroides TaxID=46969 RepID=A0A7J6W898_THATH|nr:hypothetical protein FRX31_016966 [Thalictrum thalictroides]